MNEKLYLTFLVQTFDTNIRDWFELMMHDSNDSCFWQFESYKEQFMVVGSFDVINNKI